MKLGLSHQIFEKSSNIVFYADSLNQSRIVPCAETDERTHVTLIFAIRNVPNASKNALCVARRSWRLSLSACTFKYQSSLSHEFIGQCVDSVVIHRLRTRKLNVIADAKSKHVLFSSYCSCNMQAWCLSGWSCCLVEEVV